jgi:diguanylate cyclase (GGDEF)-like protein
MRVRAEVDDESTGFGRRGLMGRAAPFVALILAGFAMVPLPPAGERAVPLIAAGLLLAAIVIGIAVAPLERSSSWLQVLPMLACLGVVALLRDSEGGAASAQSPLALVPVFWCALYGTRRQLMVIIVGVAVMFAVPRLVVGAPRYPVTEWERALLWAGTGLVVGLTVQGLVARIKLQAQQLKQLAGTDPLTGLANRRTWDEALRVELDRARRTGQPLVLGLIDLNGFKNFNDAHGHPAADRFLKEMTAAWAAVLRTTDTLARLGGDEFGLILPGLTIDEAEAVLTRLEELIPAGQTFAAGLTAADGGERPEDLLAHADKALYQSKATRLAMTEVAPA